MDQAVIEGPFSREQQVRHHHIWSNGAVDHRDRDTHIHQHPSQTGNSQRWTSWDPAIEYHSNWSAEYQPRIDEATDNHGFGGHSVLTSWECGTIFDPCTRSTAYQNSTHIHSNWGRYQPLPVPSIASNRINLRTRPLYVDPSNNCYQGEPSVALPPVTIYGETRYDLGSQHQGAIAASTNVHFGRENEDVTSWRRPFKRKKSCNSSSLRPKDNIRSQDYSSSKTQGSRRYSKSQNQCTGRRSFKRNETPNHMNNKLHLKGVSTSGNPSPRVGSDTLVMAADGDDKVVTQGMQPDQCISDSPRAFTVIHSKKNDVESPKNASKCIHTVQKTEELLMDHLTVASSEANAVNQYPVESELKSSCEKYHIFPVNTEIHVSEKDEMTDAKVDLSRDVNEKFDETEHRVNSTAAVSQKDEIAGGNTDFNREVNEKPDQTNDTVLTSKKRRKKKRSSFSKCGAEAITEENDISSRRLPISSLVGTSLDHESVVPGFGVAGDMGTNLLETDVIGRVLANDPPLEFNATTSCEKHIPPGNTTVVHFENDATAIVNIDPSHEVNGKPEETKHSLNTVAVVLESDEMAVLNPDLNHEVNEKPEGTQHIMQSNSQKRKRKRRSSSAKCRVESMMEEVTQRLPISSMGSLDNERAVSVSEVSVNGAVLANNNPSESSSACEKYHNVAACATMTVSGKAENIGVPINLNREVNEKPEETTDIVKTVSKRAKRKKHRSSSSKCAASSVTEEMIESSSQNLPIVGGTSLDHESAVTVSRATGVMTTSIPKTNVSGAALANDDPVPSKFTSSCEKYHISAVNTTLAVLEKAEIAGGTINLNHEVNEKAGQTTDIVKTVSKKAKRKKKRSSSSKCDLRSLTEEMIETSSQKLPIVGGTSMDHESAVSVLGATDVTTITIPETNVCRSVLANDHPFPSILTSSCDNPHIFPLNTTMAVLENAENVGGTINLNHEVNEKPEETSDMVKSVSRRAEKKKKRSRSSKCDVRSVTEEMIETSSQKLPILRGTSLDHESAVSVSGVTDVITLSIPKTNVTRPVLADDHPVPSNMTREKYHTCTVDTTMVILEKDEMTGVNVDLSHGECEELAETKPKKRRKKHRSSSSKCGVESLTEEMPDISSRKLSITSMGKDALEYEIAVSATGVKDDIPTKCTRTDDIETTLPDGQSLALDLTVAGEKCHSAIVDTTMVVPEKDARAAMNVGLSNEVNEELEETKHMRDSTAIVLVNNEIAGVNTDLNHERNEKLEEGKLVVLVRTKKRKGSKQSSKYGAESMTEGLTDTSSQKLPVRVTRQTYLGSPKSRRKLLVLDINGLLADIVGDFSSTLKSDFILSGKRVYKRPFCDDFLQFCFSRFNVGIWSSRTKKNVTRVIDIFMKKNKDKLLFCWDQSHCTRTGYQTLENKEKPLVLKELKYLWESKEKDLPWQRGCYDETNTILLDDSPYKALRNPPYTAVFPMPYSFKDEEDNSLGPDGDLRLYLKRLAEAENVQSFIQANPFGQRSITEADLSWSFYSKIAGEYANQEEK